MTALLSNAMRAGLDIEKVLQLPEGVKAEILDLLEEKQRRAGLEKLKAFKPYPWQREYFDAAPDHPERMLMAANQVGKTLTAGVEVAYHATGDYPGDWEGVRFDFPPLIWALGVSGEQIRDVIQDVLLGKLVDKKFTGGLIKPKQVHRFLRAAVTGGLAKDVYVKHKHGTSVISFKSYSQGQAPLMGSKVDVVWIDEEPEDREIYGQVQIRTLNGNLGKGGVMLLTMTPELGATELVNQFTEKRGPGQFLLNATWDDAPHLTEEKKASYLARIPEEQRDMRTKGLPILGSGMVFQVAENRITCDPFEIPPYFKRLCGLDFGIEHPFASVWVAYDADTDITYVYDTYRLSGATPPTHVARINGANIQHKNKIPVVAPHDGDGREKGTGEALKQQYINAGANIVAMFQNPDGGIKVEPGILDMLTRMRSGRFKVFSNLKDWFSEYRRYHRKNGMIVAIDDDIMSATRYASGMVRTHGEPVTAGDPVNQWYPELDI